MSKNVFPKHIFQCFCPKCSFDQEVPFSVLNFLMKGRFK